MATRSQREKDEFEIIWISLVGEGVCDQFRMIKAQIGRLTTQNVVVKDLVRSVIVLGVIVSVKTLKVDRTRVEVRTMKRTFNLARNVINRFKTLSFLTP